MYILLAYLPYVILLCFSLTIIIDYVHLNVATVLRNILIVTVLLELRLSHS